MSILRNGHVAMSNLRDKTPRKGAGGEGGEEEEGGGVYGSLTLGIDRATELFP